MLVRFEEYRKSFADTYNKCQVNTYGKRNIAIYIIGWKNFKKGIIAYSIISRIVSIETLKKL